MPCLLQFTHSLCNSFTVDVFLEKLKKNCAPFNPLAAEFQQRRRPYLLTSCPLPCWPNLLLGHSLPSAQTCLVWGMFCSKQDPPGPAMPLRCDQPLWAWSPPLPARASTGDCCPAQHTGQHLAPCHDPRSRNAADSRLPLHFQHHGELLHLYPRRVHPSQGLLPAPSSAEPL